MIICGYQGIGKTSIRDTNLIDDIARALICADRDLGRLPFDNSIKNMKREGQ